MVGGVQLSRNCGAEQNFGETHLERGECMSKNWGTKVIFQNLLILVLFKGVL